MKTTAFDSSVATAVENAVIEAYNCKRCDIIQFRDSDEKKVVVFILYSWYRYNWHCIGKAYQMTYLYVPTVAAELEYWYKKDVKVKEKIDLVLAKLKVSECLIAS
jgi:hypothetical protein